MCKCLFYSYSTYSIVHGILFYFIYSSILFYHIVFCFFLNFPALSLYCLLWRIKVYLILTCVCVCMRTCVCTRTCVCACPRIVKLNQADNSWAHLFAFSSSSLSCERLWQKMSDHQIFSQGVCLAVAASFSAVKRFWAPCGVLLRRVHSDTRSDADGWCHHGHSFSLLL